MTEAGFGVREVTVPAAAGADYVFVLDGHELPDPATRWQPEGCARPSRTVDSGAFSGPTPGSSRLRSRSSSSTSCTSARSATAGTFDGAIPHLDALADLGVNAIELMPIGEFPGHRGWGYDGVYISAAALLLRRSRRPGKARGRRPRPRHRRDPRRRLQPRRRLGQHGAAGLRALPHGQVRHASGARRSTSTTRTRTPCASGCCSPPRAGSRDFHVDGLRLDAIHAIFDGGAEHLVAAISRRVHAANHSRS